MERSYHSPRGASNAMSFEEGWKHAAEGNSAVFSDAKSGLNLDLVALMKEARKNDPRLPFKERVAEQLVDFIQNVRDRAERPPVVLDVGCAIGEDVGLYAAKLAERGLSGRMLGVDLLEKLLESAREAYPQATFLRGDVHALPLSDNEVDAAHCERLLYHSTDIEKALDEFVRVLRPGGLAVLVEGDARAGLLLTDDERVKAIDEKRGAFITQCSSCPYAATKAYKYLKTHPGVEHAHIRADAMVTTDAGLQDPGLAMTRQTLQKMVEDGRVSADDAEHYVQALERAPSCGDPLGVYVMFVISFHKSPSLDV